MQTEEKNQTVVKKQSYKDATQIVDYKVTMLIAAGAAMAANCEPCLNKIVPDLLEAGVAEADIRKAVEIGQFVKDKPAAIMKEAADALTGSHLSDNSVSDGCPAEKMKTTAAVAGCSG
jgi:alkylhydroperoxidase/carboxymuconolactone decarboxylase family protein YurZ